MYLAPSPLLSCHAIRPETGEPMLSRTLSNNVRFLPDTCKGLDLFVKSEQAKHVAEAGFFFIEDVSSLACSRLPDSGGGRTRLRKQKNWAGTGGSSPSQAPTIFHLLCWYYRALFYYLNAWKYGVRGVSRIKFTISDSFLVFFDFEILFMIKRKKSFWFLLCHFDFEFVAFDFSNDTFDFQNLSRLISQMTLLISKICRVWFLKWHFWSPKFVAFDSQMTLLISNIRLYHAK